MRRLQDLAAWWRSTRTPFREAFRRPWPTTRRGLVLALFSVAFVWVGSINYIATALPAITRRYLAFWLQLLPAPAWGWLMIAVALFALYTSYCHFGRDRAGYVVLSSYCATWGVGYVCGWLWFDAPLRALGGSVIWLLFSAILTAVAGFPNVALHRSDVIAPLCQPPDPRGRP